MATPVVHQVGIFDSSGNPHFPRDVVSGTITIEAAGGSPDWANGKPLTSVEFSAAPSGGGLSTTATATAERRSQYGDPKYFAKAIAQIAGGATAAGNLGVFSVDLDTTVIADGETTVTITGTDSAANTHSYTFTLWVNNSATISTQNFYINADTGDDTTGDGSSGNPWQTWAKARNEAVAVHSATNQAIINVATGTTAEYSRTRGSGFTRQTVGPRVVTRAWGSGTAKFDIPTSTECRLSYQRWEGCVFDSTNTWNESNGQANDLAFWDCSFSSDLGRAAMTFTATPLFDTGDVDAVYMLGCNLGNYNRKGITGKAWMRDCVIEDVSTDGANPEGASGAWPGNCMFGCWVEDTDTAFVTVPDPHGDGLQIIDPQAAHMNILVANCGFTDVGYSGQAMLADNLYGVCKYNLHFAHVDASTSAFSQMGNSVGGANIVDAVIANVTHPNHGFGWRTPSNTVSNAKIHSAIIKEFNTGLGDTGTAATDIAITTTGSSTSDPEVTVLTGNPFENGAGPTDNWSLSLDDYRPASGGGLPVVAAGDRFTAYDMIGNEVPDDGTAVVGALQTIPVSGSVTPDDDDSHTTVYLFKARNLRKRRR